MSSLPNPNVPENGAITRRNTNYLNVPYKHILKVIDLFLFVKQVVGDFKETL